MDHWPSPGGGRQGAAAHHRPIRSLTLDPRKGQTLFPHLWPGLSTESGRGILDGEESLPSG